MPLIERNVIPIFSELLSSEHEEIVEQAVWAIGNIGADKSQYRDDCIKYNCIEKLMCIYEKTEDFNLKK